MGWATSIIQFHADGDFLAVASLNIQTDAFEPGADDVLDKWRAQRTMCERNKSEYVEQPDRQRGRFAGSLLANQGVALEVVSTRLGDADIRTTAERYLHVFRERDAAAARALDALGG